METGSTELDAEYRLTREGCGMAMLDRAWIEVSGPDAAEYLQSQVTNEVADLRTGEGTYAALLDRKGKVQADMRIVRPEVDRFLLDTEPGPSAALLKHLETYRIGREVEIERSDRDSIALVGPGTGELVALPDGGEHSVATEDLGETTCLVIRTPWGVDVASPAGTGDEVLEALKARGADGISEETLETVRVEAGRPRFGSEIGPALMPAEVGIVERAVSFEKGCYIGQEPVARLHYKGRPNRFLRGLRFGGEASPGDRLVLAERDLGTVGSVALSPVEGRIGLAVVRKEAAPGDEVEVVTASGTIAAEVVELPFPAGRKTTP